MHVTFYVSSFSCSGDMKGFQNLKVSLLPLSVGGSGPTSSAMFHAPQECSLQTASAPVQPFLHSEAEVSRVTDRQTDTANIGNNSQHLMHSMQPKSVSYLSRMTKRFCATNRTNMWTSSQNLLTHLPPTCSKTPVSLVTWIVNIVVFSCHAKRAAKAASFRQCYIRDW